LRARLGFHLSRCQECQHYFEEHEALLSHLLLTPPARTASRQHATPRNANTPHKQHRRTTYTMLQWVGVAVAVLLLAFIIHLAGVMLRTQQNIAAMIVTPAPTIALPTSTPTASLALASVNQGVSDTMATPTATPWPTIQAMPTPTATPTPTPEMPVPDVGEAATILLLGNDRRPDEPAMQRSDAIMLVRVDPQNERIALLSLPRDLIVDIPGYVPQRINNAYLIGEASGPPGTGMQLARTTVSNFLGIPVDYVVAIDFQGFIGLIDTLGGVEVNVEKELYDAQFPTMDYGYTVAHFVPGRHHMDGVMALTYSRIRHPDSDFMRIRRQQAVMVGIGERLRQRGDLHNLLAADQITASLKGYVLTDMPQERILGLVWAFRNYDVNQVEHYAATFEMVSMGIGNDLYALVPNRAAFDQLTRQFLGTP
jgi:LCP family protein required for cell wall assembly